MKKIIALILGVMLVLSLVACGDQDDVRGEITENSKVKTSSVAESSAAEAEAAFDIGTSDAGKYENKFLGLGIKLDGWTFATDAEMAEMNNTVADIIGDDYLKAVEKNQVIYDMTAQSEDQFNSMNINFENLVVSGAILINEENYIEQSIKANDFNTMFANMGYENITIDKTTVTVAGKQHAGMTVHATIQGYDFYERLVCIKKGKYMANITATSLGTDKTQELLDGFYEL